MFNNSINSSNFGFAGNSSLSHSRMIKALKSSELVLHRTVEVDYLVN